MSRSPTRLSRSKSARAKGREIVEIRPSPSADSQLIEGFLTLVEAEKMILPGFDWQEWSLTVEAEKLCLGGEAVERASRAELSRLITLLIRRDRFVEGALEEAARSGLLGVIAKRLNPRSFAR